MVNMVNKMTTKVVNKKNEDYDINIARVGNNHLNTTKIGKPGWLGNPYKLKYFNRKQSINLYKRDFLKRIKTDKRFKIAILKLKGKRLGCYCKPKDCHGDIIKEYIESMEE